jgi:hypothetical protein
MNASGQARRNQHIEALVPRLILQTGLQRDLLTLARRHERRADRFDKGWLSAL